MTNILYWYWTIYI